MASCLWPTCYPQRGIRRVYLKSIEATQSATQIQAKMLLRHALIVFAICLAGCPAVAATIAFFRDEWALRAFASIYIYTAIGLTLLGAVAAVGAGSGGDERLVDSVSLNATEYAREDNQDAALGIGFGWVVFIAGALSLGGAYLIHKLAAA